MPASQGHRPFAVTTPLGDDVLLLLRMEGSEALSQLFRYNLELLSLDHSIDINAVLGKHMTVRAETREEGVRHFDGVVSDFSYRGSHGKYARYEATLRPWLWLLTRSADCRIFQGDSSVDIAKKIFGDHGFDADFDPTKITAPAKREYCTQYRESAFDFLSRLFEHDGIYYFFQHEPGKHKLVLADGAKCHATVPKYETIQFFPEGSAGSSEADRLLEWNVTQSLETGTFAHTDYDFTKPKAKLETRSVISREHAQSSLEVFDYPGRYVETGVGETLARVRIEELQATHEVSHGSGTIRGLGAGSLFTLSEHPRASLNKSYLVVSAKYLLDNPEYETGMDGVADPAFHTSITAIPEKSTYRPPRVTPKQRVQGPQTATVTGEGSDVWTDQYGRIKVHFHWDHKGTSDATSSCWLRVSQNWAGKNWGGMFLPHIGQEVIVDFLEGDPDQPIVTGRVYNQDNMPPLLLPDKKLNSILRDNYGNELIFDATPGDEHIVLHSPHHSSILTLGRSAQYETKSDSRWFTNGTAETHTVGSTITTMLGNAFSFTGGATESITIGATGSLFVGFKVDLNAGTKLAVDIGGSMTFNYNYSYKWGWSAETNVNKKEYLRSSGSDITHDSMKSVILVGGPKDNSILTCGPDSILMEYGEDPNAPEDNPAAVSAGAALKATATGAAAAALAGGAAFSAGMNNVAGNWKDEQIDTKAKKETSPLLHTNSHVAALVGGGVLSATLWGVTFAQMKKLMSDVGKKKAKQATTHSKAILNRESISLVKLDGKTEKAFLKLLNDHIEMGTDGGDISIKTTGQIILDAQGGVIIKQNKMKTEDSTQSWNM